MFRWIARIEGLSFVVLMGVAMPLKYGFDLPAAVRHAGRAHGLLVLGCVVAMAVAARAERWPLRKVVWAFLSSMIPFGWVFFEASDRLDREGS